MFYPSRVKLGGELASKLANWRDKDVIILCLKRSSLVSCIALAAQIHAYVYVLQYSEVEDPYNSTRPLGAVTSAGDFVLNPDITQSEYDYICGEFFGKVEQNKNDAFKKVNMEDDANPNFDLAAFNRRNILIFADVLSGVFEVEVAFKLLEPFVPRSIYGAFGNITTSVSDKFRMETDGIVYMDVLQSSLFDDEHYFESLDNYTEEQTIKMANMISLYWQ